MTTLDEIEKRLEAAQRNADTGFTFIAHAPTDIARLLRIARAAEDLIAPYEAYRNDPYDVGLATVDDCIVDIRKALEASNDHA